MNGNFFIVNDSKGEIPTHDKMIGETEPTNNPGGQIHTRRTKTCLFTINYSMVILPVQILKKNFCAETRTLDTDDFIMNHGMTTHAPAHFRELPGD